MRNKDKGIFINVFSNENNENILEQKWFIIIYSDPYG